MKEHDLVLIIVGTIACIGIIGAAINQRADLEVRRLEAQAALAEAQRPRQTTIQLDLTPAAMEACKRLFITHTQGGHVDEYRCRWEKGTVSLYGPNWRKATNGKAPIELLGQERLK
ncbi:MAG: hypothetical protein N2318_01025 [Meiothermus sp.]|nr:hypothetical protein [Meiothermus sp.]